MIDVKDQNFFCHWHIHTIDDVKNPTCLAHLADDRLPECPYATPEEREKAEFPCSDYRVRKAEMPKLGDLGQVVEAVVLKPIYDKVGGKDGGDSI